MDDLLAHIEAYYDALPRTAARAEPLGSFTLFVNRGPGWTYYARPTLGATTFSAADVAQVRARQRALGVPEALEWVAETTPGVRPAAEAAGLQVREHPLLVLDRAARRRAPAPAGAGVRLVTDEDDLALLGAVARVAFGVPGTAVGSEGIEALAAARAGRALEDGAFERGRLRAGWTIMAAAWVDGHPVAIGSHQPIAGVSEVVGVATLPAYRRRGIAAALTDALVEDALRGGRRTIFLSAGDATVARVYQRLGFGRIATACVADASDYAHEVTPSRDNRRVSQPI